MATPLEFQGDPLLGKDIPWKVIEKQFCRVKHFTPLATVEEGNVSSPSITMPYALLTIESPKLPQEALMPVAHRLDFRNLWEIFEQRGVGDNEEVLVSYVSNFFENWTAPVRALGTFLSAAGMPKLHLFIFPKGHLEEMYDPTFRPSSARDWFLPIAEWHPKGWHP